MERRKLREKVQNNFRKNLSVGAKSVLSEDYKEESKPVSYDVLVDFWSRIFARESIQDGRPVSVVGHQEGSPWLTPFVMPDVRRLNRWDI